MEPRKWRWVSRDDRSNMLDVWDSEEKPEWEDGYFCSEDDDHGFTPICCKGFRALFGIDIKPGTCVRVEFTAKVLEDGTP